MQIFQKSVIKKHLNNLDTEKVNKAFETFNNVYSPEKIQEIKNLKEEEYQDGFLRDLFVQVFGYTLKPDDNYNLVRELKNQADSKKADGAILRDDKAIAVIELKSTKTKDLTSITQQAFNYKNNQPGCKYVITSNFQKLRFYIDYANEYEEFDLFALQKADFDLLYLILSKENIFADLPQTLKDETRFHEQKVSENLYNDYSNLKYKIFNNLVKNNPQYDKLTLFEKSQKLLDRLLFIFFAEDSDLLPANSIARIIEHHQQLVDLDAEKPLYEIYKQYFGYMNKGRKGKKSVDDIPAYNGGLFAPDEILDSATIDDEILKNDSLKLSAYDFNTEVDVNILGHIFEHSLNEIEEIEKQLFETDDIKVIKTSRRKKDGVFYTPKYITQYIVENTLGKLCEQKRKEEGIFDVEFDESYKAKKGLNKKGKELFEKLTAYKNWLSELKIVDPACGSGAFLNQALSFLITEHKKMDEIIAELTGDAIGLFDTDKAILENNLFGVDINQEGVEIAKLSLWLRTAQKGRKLSHLNNNIKAGNSLVDETMLNYRKTFNWKNEFADIMKSGGFDVVIGNPPYIKEYTNREAFTGLHEHYCYQGKMDLWYFFGALALDIVKKDSGLIGYIAPNNWITNSGASKFRNIVLDKGKLIEFIDFGNFKVFDTAGIQTMVYIMQPSTENENYELEYSKIIDSKINHETNQQFLEKVDDERFQYFTTKINKQEFLNKTIHFIDALVRKVIDKIAIKQNFALDKKEVAQGIVPPQDFLNKKNKEILGNEFKVGEGIFNLSQTEYENLNLSDKEKELVKPFYTTNELGRFYGKSDNEYWVIYTNSSFKKPETIIPYPNLKKHLDKFAKVITSDNKPYGLHRAREEKFFTGENIMSVRKCARPTFTFTDFDCYISQTYFSIKNDRLNLKYLTGLLNSKLIAFWLKYKGKMQGDNYQIDKAPLLELPLIKPNTEKQTEISDLVSQIIENKQKQLDYSQLRVQAKKADNFDREIKLTKELETIKTEIQTTENRIDTEVYNLYALSEKDIAMIEKEIK
ncbi:MAG: DNA methyltransferase [Bacteroidota bacterium]|nr:DNA methyltransferase [Bacteroidota bacterium]